MNAATHAASGRPKVNGEQVDLETVETQSKYAFMPTHAAAGRPKVNGEQVNFWKLQNPQAQQHIKGLLCVWGS